MNFMVQSLIQDLENMGIFPESVSDEEWREKWTALKGLSKDEYDFVRKACSSGAKLKAWHIVQDHDPDPAKTQRSKAFDGLFKI